MKFLCNDCNHTMDFVDNTPSETGGSLSIRYQCPSCGRSISMVTNSGETQVVRSLGVSIGHEAIQSTPEPMAMMRQALAGQLTDLAEQDPLEPVWTDAATKRLSAAPGFVQSMIRRLYSDYARRKGYSQITPAIMSEAREALGMEEM